MHTKNYFLSFMVAFVFCWTNLAAQEQPFTYVVATDNSGDFTTVQAAVDACKEGEQRSIIFIKNGTYKEMVNVPKGKIISLIGESAEGVLITFDRDRGAGSDFTDFRDITTCQFYGEDMYVEGLTIENSSGNVGQAEAHYVASDRQTYKNCRFLGYQDTQRTNSGARAYFKDCFIQGATDFIFGDGLMYYDNCTVTYVMAVDEVAFTGRVVCIGYAKNEVAFQTKYFVQKELNICGSRNALPADFRGVINLLKKGNFQTDRLISKVVKPELALQAMQEWIEAPGKIFRILVEF